MHLLVTRPDTGGAADALEIGLVAQGHTVTRAPMLTIHSTGAMPDLAGAQALIATSRNALKAVAPIPEAAAGLPLFAVGPATAALARALGFATVIEGPGEARALADVIGASLDPAAGGLVHLAGDVVAFDLAGALEPAGFRVSVEPVYRAEAVTELPPDVADAHRRRAFDGVVLMSPRTAKVYVNLVADAGLATEALHPLYFCLSAAVRREIEPLGTVRAAVARSPNSQEMLALIACEAPDSA